MIKKIKMNSGKNALENGNLKSKMKEHLSISLFTLITAFLALFLTDMIIFPLTYYSVRNVDIFNIFFKYSLLFLIIATLSVISFLKARSLHRDGKAPSFVMYMLFIRIIPALITLFFLVKISDIFHINSVLFFLFILVMMSDCTFFKNNLPS